MRATERYVIYAGLVLAIALGLGWRGIDARATAHSAALTAETRIGSVDVLALLQQMLMTEEFAEIREERRQSLMSSIENLGRDLEELEAELRLMGPGDPAGQQLIARYQQKQQELQMMSQEANIEFQALSAGQAAEVYERIHEAANRVAREHGYTHVVATRLTASIEDRSSLAAVTQEILARPLIQSSEGDDLTDKVREALDLPEMDEFNADDLEPVLPPIE